MAFVLFGLLNHEQGLSKSQSNSLIGAIVVGVVSGGAVDSGFGGRAANGLNKQDWDTLNIISSTPTKFFVLVPAVSSI